jgi:hypothetical protein
MILGQMDTWVMEEVGWWFIKDIGVLCSRSKQLPRATTLPGSGMGLSLKFTYLSAGSLVLYKGL